MPVHHGAEIMFNMATKTVAGKSSAVPSAGLLRALQAEAAAHGDTLTAGSPSEVTITYNDGTKDVFASSSTNSGRKITADGVSSAQSWK